MKTVDTIKAELAHLGDANRAAATQRFFKTGKGEYGEGDVFRGIAVPVLRTLAAKYKSTNLTDAEELLHSTFHEDRLLALLILGKMFASADAPLRSEIYKCYLRNTRFINNWDLVDSSAGYIVGRFLADKDKTLLSTLAHSDVLWERRIAILSTSYFIGNGHFEETFRISDILLTDREDLIHKAVGWMLREVGKRDLEAEEAFLQERYARMPRTMLRYAIERFPETRRQAYLKGKV